jgi:hypothetical protein
MHRCVLFAKGLLLCHGLVEIERFFNNNTCEGNHMDIQNHTFIITGGSSGLGGGAFWGRYFLGAVDLRSY